jgi:hypothetical protein
MYELLARAEDRLREALGPGVRAPLAITVVTRHHISYWVRN